MKQTRANSRYEDCKQCKCNYAADLAIRNWISLAIDSASIKTTLKGHKMGKSHQNGCEVDGARRMKRWPRYKGKGRNGRGQVGG